MSEVYCFLTELLLEPPNGERYLLVGGRGPMLIIRKNVQVQKTV